MTAPLLPLFSLLVAAAAAGSAPGPLREPAAPLSGQTDEDPGVAEIRAKLRAAQTALAPEATRLAERAVELGYHSAARRLFELVLTLQPDSEEARRGLGMRKRGGAWVASNQRPKRDQVEEEDRRAFESASAAVLRAAVARVDGSFPSEEVVPVLREERRRALEALLAIDPDDAALRERVGDAWDPGRDRWDLREVVSARRARVADAALLERIRADLPPTAPARLDPHAQKAGVEFPVLIGSEELFVATTEPEEEAQRLHDLVWTAQRFLKEAFGEEPRFPVPVSVLSLPDPAIKHRFLLQHPLVGEAKLAEHEGLFGTWVLRQMVLSAPERVERLDMGTFLTATVFLQEVFGKRGEAGWVKQSLASYLAARVSGTHLSFLVGRDAYGADASLPWPERVPPVLEGWLAAARPLLDEGRPLARFARALTAPTHAMTWEDVVVGYAFGAYLFEGRRGDLAALLRRIGRGEEKTAAIEDVLDMPLSAVRTRLATWIDRMAEAD